MSTGDAMSILLIQSISKYNDDWKTLSYNSNPVEGILLLLPVWNDSNDFWKLETGRRHEKVVAIVVSRTDSNSSLNSDSDFTKIPILCGKPVYMHVSEF